MNQLPHMFKQSVIILILFSGATNLIAQGNKYFEIQGIAAGMSDSTTLYLEFKDGNDEIRDSTFVISDRFSFRGEVKSKVVHALIKTQKYRDYKFFWLENSMITFKAEKGNFRNAIITGSETQDEQNSLDLLTGSLPHKKRMWHEKKFVSDHPNSFISTYILNVYSSTWGKDTTTLLYEKLSEEQKHNIYGKEIYNFISLNRNVKVGDKYVDFSQTDTNGDTISLSDFQGKVVLLEFWGSWCGPCREANPELVNIYNEFKNKGFEILGVGAELKKEVWLNAIKKDKLLWPNVSDLKGDNNEAALIYGISYYPANFLIDDTGTIIAKDLSGDKLRKKLTEMLVKK